jgi:hypothetical protein
MKAMVVKTQTVTTAGMAASGIYMTALLLAIERKP